MTLEEKAERYTNNKADRGNYDYAVGDNVYFSKSALEYAYIAGATENGIIWHDLRKNPDDLPGKGKVVFSRVVMTNEGFREYCNTFTGEWFAAGTFELVDKPRAWCEIPKYTEE